ncbi:hypothetical protein DH2020_045136 [Rehmannia glutinosa]|uniref:Uncharacterized protein n=1 Tax=Rehmannia glutinosa TaxID=99300 RepID=A0ABR0UFX1_REHGL
MAAIHNFTIANPSPIYLPITSSTLICKPSLSLNLPNNNVSHFFGTTLPTIHSHHNSIPTLSRRLIIPAVSGLWDALTGGNPARDAVIAVRRGMLLFRQGDVQGSLVEFDKAIELDPRQKASQLYGVDEARKRFLEVGTDSRPVMREAYRMFKDGGDPEKVIDINSYSMLLLCSSLVAAFSGGRESEYFYASLYAGLYYESQNKSDEAKLHLTAACKSPYGSRSDDYMASLAKVHCDCRNW